MREHGTRARYVHGPDEEDRPGSGCRCGGCSRANREADEHRSRMRLYGRWQPYVDAGPAREHVRALGKCGIGVRRVAKLAGISDGAINKLMYGGPGARPPSRRIRPQTEAAILAVMPSRALLGGRALVDGTATRRRLQALVATGRPKACLARRLGMLLSNLTGVMERGQVTAATERAVAALYDDLWDKPPPEATRRERQSASRARNYAAARGWALPWQWDDDAIGDPSARPDPLRDSRPPRGQDLLAEAAELAGYGLDRRQIAERLGVSRNTLDMALARAGRQAPDRETAA